MKSKFTAWSSALMLGTVATVGHAADAGDTDVRAELQELRSQVQHQQAEIERLRSQDDNWLNEQRTEEVRSLVHDVLRDADSRASFQEGGLTAGRGDHFFIASDDGNFLLNVDGQVQTRYIYNHRDGTLNPGSRRNRSGFDIRRAKLGFHGHIIDPRYTYGVRGNFSGSAEADLNQDEAFDVAGGSFRLEEAWFGWEFADGWQAKVGQFKAPFLREELVYSSRQLAVERSLTSDLFSAGYTQGVQLGYQGEMLRAAGMLHAGSRAANTSWARVPSTVDTDIALAGRVEALAMGSWEQFDEFVAWSDEEFGLLVGAAANYEVAAGGIQGDPAFTPGVPPRGNDVLRWTLDASVQVPEAMGFNAFGAVIGNHPQPNGELGDGGTYVDQWGLVAQAGIFAIPDTMDIFGRWEYLDLMNRDIGDTQAVNSRKTHTFTAGTNYYLNGHAAKATFDVVWMLDANPTFAPGHGLLVAPDDQVALRAQFQFLF